MMPAPQPLLPSGLTYQQLRAGVARAVTEREARAVELELRLAQAFALEQAKRERMEEQS